jgi:hypothetical protein
LNPTATVTILGMRYPDFSVEESVLAPHGARVVGGDGSTPDAIVEQAGDATSC